jgi:hypothetical protein
MQRHATLLGLGAAALFCAACANGGDRPTIRLRPGDSVDLTKVDLRKQSLLMDLKEGEVIPLYVNIDGDVVTSAPGAAIPLTVKKNCFLRIDDRGLRISEDGQNFDAKPRVPGSFQFGVGVTKEGKRATITLVTPRR